MSDAKRPQRTEMPTNFWTPEFRLAMLTRDFREACAVLEQQQGWMIKRYLERILVGTCHDPERAFVVVFTEAERRLRDGDAPALPLGWLTGIARAHCRKLKK